MQGSPPDKGLHKHYAELKEILTRLKGDIREGSVNSVLLFMGTVGRKVKNSIVKQNVHFLLESSIF